MPELDWTVDPHADVPPSRQLVHRALDAFASGAFAPGDRLPSVRQLAGLALVNHNTAARAYRELEDLGVVRGENGLGVFATDAAERIVRELRLDATLESFQEAAREALRAGHPLTELQGELASVASKAARPRKSA